MCERAEICVNMCECAEICVNMWECAGICVNMCKCVEICGNMCKRAEMVIDKLGLTFIFSGALSLDYGSSDLTFVAGMLCNITKQEIMLLTGRKFVSRISTYIHIYEQFEVIKNKEKKTYILHSMV